MLGSVLQRIRLMPEGVSIAFATLAFGGIYWFIAVATIILGCNIRLPLTPSLDVCILLLIWNALSIAGIYRAISWSRAFIVLKPFVIYPLEYGLAGVSSLSIQSMELVSSFAWLFGAIYLLYISRASRDWFLHERPGAP